MEVWAELFGAICAAGCWRRSMAAARPRRRRSCSRSAFPTSTRRWARRAATGETEARPQRNRQTLKLADHHAAIAAEVALRPDVTLDELRAWLLATHQVDGQPRPDAQDAGPARADAQKKSGRAEEQDRPDVAERRADWRAGQGALSPARLVFVDETGAATNMARRYGRSPRGQRLDGPMPHGHWKSTTFVGGLTSARLRRPLRPRRRR